jgi:uncharacterized membrane protein
VTGDEAGALSLAGGLAIVGVLGLVLARAGAAGTLPRNAAVGIRTRRTRRSDAAWKAGHRAAAGPLRFAGVVGLAAAVLTPVAVSTVSGSAAWWLVLGALVVVVALLVRATRAADRAAEEA